MKTKPNFDSAKIGCVTRATDKIWPSSPAGVLSVSTLNAPTSKPANCPDNLSPTRQAHRLPLHQADIAREERPSVVRHPVLRVAAEAAPAEFERRDVLQEEIARFRREQREPRRVDLADVQRRIGKIRIDGERVGQRGRHLVKGVAARGEAQSGAVAFELPIMLHARRAIDLHVQPDALADVLDPDQIAGLADVGEVERWIESRPMDALVLVVDAARDVEAPGGLRRPRRRGS